MNIYFWIFSILSVVVLMVCMTAGFQKGFVREFNSWISLLAAVVSIILIGKILDSFKAESFSRIVIGFILLALFGLIYKIYKMIFESLDLMAKLPVIRVVDKALGFVMGLIQGFTILYLVEYLMRNFLL